jgi:hypothetical protein
MLKTQAGSETGAVTSIYEAGQVYELGHSAGALDLAAVFLREGWGEDADAPKAPPPSKGRGK